MSTVTVQREPNAKCIDCGAGFHAGFFESILRCPKCGRRFDASQAPELYGLCTLDCEPCSANSKMCPVTGNFYKPKKETSQSDLTKKQNNWEVADYLVEAYPNFLCRFYLAPTKKVLQKLEAKQ